ncbi:hypothetical protein [Janthinobacterium sp. B9-8]|uniref:hypothetical protein n=1 Tax=Janthinobacterium sp. B9-8 TaxID=1236179 RepID=UPI00061CE347|nr:hypothetical protein [Janthinobacterium sp. B9-8]AMC34789.1 hypothetical protein VN23_09290 [Janthinobacterium sp. B9-8]
MIKLSDTQIKILGRQNFACMRIAQLLIAAGIYEDKAKKAEYEQAVFIHWASALFDECGEKWLEVAETKLDELNEKIKAKAVENE